MNLKVRHLVKDKPYTMFFVLPTIVIDEIEGGLKWQLKMWKLN